MSAVHIRNQIVLLILIALNEFRLPATNARCSIENISCNLSTGVKTRTVSSSDVRLHGVPMPSWIAFFECMNVSTDVKTRTVFSSDLRLYGVRMPSWIAFPECMNFALPFGCSISLRVVTAGPGHWHGFVIGCDLNCGLLRGFIRILSDLICPRQADSEECIVRALCGVNLSTR